MSAEAARSKRPRSPSCRVASCRGFGRNAQSSELPRQPRQKKLAEFWGSNAATSRGVRSAGGELSSLDAGIREEANEESRRASRDRKRKKPPVLPILEEVGSAARRVPKKGSSAGGRGKVRRGSQGPRRAKKLCSEEDGAECRPQREMLTPMKEVAPTGRPTRASRKKGSSAAGGDLLANDALSVTKMTLEDFESGSRWMQEDGSLAGGGAHPAGDQPSAIPKELTDDELLEEVRRLGRLPNERNTPSSREEDEERKLAFIIRQRRG